MLVLSRKRNEKVIISIPPSNGIQQIEVELVDIRGDKARIGFSAADTIAIHRKEVQEAINKTNPNAPIPYRREQRK